VTTCRYCAHAEKDGHEEPCAGCVECGVPYIEEPCRELNNMFEPVKEGKYATYTWDELYERADGCACGSPELKAKDEARWKLRELIKYRTGTDIEQCEIPEEEIDRFLEQSEETFYFNRNGHLVGVK